MPQKPALDRSSAAFDYQAWFETWRREYLFYRVDAEDMIRFISPKVRELLGYAPAELTGQPLWNFIQPDISSNKSLDEEPARPISEKGIEIQRCVARARDGQFVYLIVYSRKIFDEHGVHVATGHMAHDDTQRVEAERCLQASELKYRRLVEGIEGDYFLYAHLPGGEITYLSPSVFEVTGYRPEEAVGMNWQSFASEKNLGREIANQVQEELQAGKQFHHLVVTIAHLDGTMRLLEIQEHPIYDEQGKYVSMEGIARDITEITKTTIELRELRDKLEERVAERTAELRQKNQELLESEARYRGVVEMQTEFLVQWTPDLKRTFVNEAFARYMDKPPEELVGRSFLPVIVEEDRQKIADAIAKLTPERHSTTYEHQVYRADGSISWVQRTDTAFFDENRQPVEYLSVGRDVTELKEAQDRIREKELHLEHVSRLATMGEMIAGIAHEVHQPLHAASAFAEAARRRLVSGGPGSVETAIGCTREIAEAIARTAKIIRRLRDFTKPTSERMESLDLNSVVRESVEIVASEMRRAEVFVKLQLDNDLPSIVGDRIQLQQICVNLITNACEAMHDIPRDQRQLVIHTCVADGQTVVSFCDCGCGLEATDIDATGIEHIFDAFYTTKSEGTGMGLSICRSIAEAHLAHLTAHANQPEPGLTFSLEFSPENRDLMHGRAAHD